jgi:hypothetical protein
MASREREREKRKTPKQKAKQLVEVPNIRTPQSVTYS